MGELDKKLLVRIALLLILLSGVFWFGMIAVPFVPMPLSAAQKGALALGLFIAAEITFWAGALLVGREVVSRYTRLLWPPNWFREQPEDQQGNDGEPEPALCSPDEDDRTVGDHEEEEESD